MTRVCHAILRAVSEENVALVRRNYEFINSIDRSGEEFVDPDVAAPDLWAGLAPDFEISGRSDVPDAGPTAAGGIEGVLADAAGDIH